MFGCSRPAHSTESLFWLACDQMEVDCEGVTPPQVVFLSPDDPKLEGAWGIFYGTDDPAVVYVDASLTGIRRWEVIYHETIHYVQYHVVGIDIPNFPELICPLEAEAWELSESFWNANTPEGEHADYSEWWKPYGYCHQWYDPDYDPFSGWVEIFP